MIAYEGGEEFVRAVAAALGDDEAEHSLLLGLAEAVAKGLPVEARSPESYRCLVRRGDLSQSSSRPFW